MALDKETLEARERLREKHKEHLLMNEEKKEDIKNRPAILEQQKKEYEQKILLRQKMQADKIKAITKEAMERCNECSM